MREFLEPWRRKIGAVALVMACGLFVLWIRSITEMDCVGAGIAGRIYYCRASGGMLSFLSLKPSMPPPLLIGGSMNLAKFVKFFPPEKFGEYSIVCVPDPSSNLWVGKMEFAILPKQKGRRDVIVPFWSIVIPLTLLSAYLLLRKPRPPKLSEPPPTTAI